jgi:spermidine/putrescine transport system substrate-binding protein
MYEQSVRHGIQLITRKIKDAMRGFMERLSTYSIRIVILLLWFSITLVVLYFPRYMMIFEPRQSINVCTFPRVIDVQLLSKFEHETGIKVYVSYYENNDELLAKMRQTKGQGYDLIFPSDYAVELLSQQHLLQKIKPAKLSFFKDIHPRLLGHYYDPQNEYSIPYLWGLYGIGINRAFFTNSVPPAQWAAIFDRSVIHYSIGMLNNAREAILLTALYLFGSIDNLDANKLEEIKQLLLCQKAWVESYTDIGADYLLLSGSCPVVAALSNDIAQARKYNCLLEMVIPNKSTFMVIDAAVIPISSTKADLVYALLNFLYRPEIIKHHVALYAHYAPIITGELATLPGAEAFSMLDSIQQVEFFRNVVSETALQDIWLSLKAST